MILAAVSATLDPYNLHSSLRTINNALCGAALNDSAKLGLLRQVVTALTYLVSFAI